MRKRSDLSSEDSERVRAALARRGEGESMSLTTVCSNAARLLGMTGVTVVLMGKDTTPSVACVYGVSSVVQDAELTLGQGPATEAYSDGSAIIVDDLEMHRERWPHLAGVLIDAGIRSAYGLPLHLGAIKLGALVLYRDEPGVLDGEALSEAFLVAGLITHLLLDMQAQASSEFLAWGLEVDDDRSVVHQATGMISVQLDCDIEEALLRLRGYAYSTDRPIREVAIEVVTRKLRFDETTR